MKLLKSLAALAAAFSLTASPALAEDTPDTDAAPTTVVLIHGAFADGSSWNRVTPLLQDAGLNVISVQNPLESLEGDVAFATRAIESAPGDVVLVGHSWGGMVITEAGVHNKVKSLVYVAAYAPDAGQSLIDVASAYPDAPGLGFLVPDAQGYLRLTAEGVSQHFAHDLSTEEQALITATQGALNASALEQTVTNVAWRERPSFAVIAGSDTMTMTELQRDQVARIGATAVEVDASHVVMLSQPEIVADLIIQAAQ